MEVTPAPAANSPLQSPWNMIPSILESYSGGHHTELFAAVAEHFSSKYGSPEILQQIPVLTNDAADSIAPNSLVRFRGMIVDMYNPEFFLGAYKTSAGGPWKPAALYTDAFPDDIDAASETKIFERRPMLVTLVPHEQPWATAAWAGTPVTPPTPIATDRTKRTREEVEAKPPAAAAADAQAQAPKAARISSTSDPADAPLKDLDALPSAAATDQNGYAAAVKAPAAAAAAVDEHQQQQPAFRLGDCIVQVYGEHEQFQLHDVVEVLGVLSVIPELAALNNMDHQQQQQEGDDLAGDGMEVDEFWQERAAALPPTSQVMRVHAFAIRKDSSYNKLNSSSSSSSDAPGAAAAVPKSLPGGVSAHIPLLRQRALQLLAAPLAGDELAAEYLLMAALGSVVDRDDGAVGLLSLNLTQCPSSSSSGGKASQVIPGLTAALSCLLPHVARLPLTITALNNTRWYPQQHAASGRLFRGALQLSEGTLLLLDETEIAAGQLGDNGVKNLHALKQVLTNQQLPCGCQVYTHNLNVNQPTVVLSTSRSILRDSIALQIPLLPQRPVLVKPPSFDQSKSGQTYGRTMFDWSNAEVVGADEVTAAAAAMPELAAVREYVAAVRGLQCRMDQAAAESCVARFRAQQQLDRGLGLEDLNNIITLSKLLSASLGHEVFCVDSWDRAMQLEQLRKQRVAAAHPQQH